MANCSNGSLREREATPTKLQWIAATRGLGARDDVDHVLAEQPAIAQGPLVVTRRTPTAPDQPTPSASASKWPPVPPAGRRVEVSMVAVFTGKKRLLRAVLVRPGRKPLHFASWCAAEPGPIGATFRSHPRRLAGLSGPQWSRVAAHRLGVAAHLDLVRRPQAACSASIMPTPWASDTIEEPP